MTHKHRALVALAIVTLAAGTWTSFACSKDPAPATPTPSSEGGEAAASAADLESVAVETYEVAPKLLHMDSPVYPEDAKQAGLEGLVHVRGLVGLDGKVQQALVGKSSGVESLDQAALDATSTCRFEPALQSGKPVRVWVQVPIRFSLESKDEK